MSDSPGRRETAYRLFAAEFEDADFEYSESDEERAPNYVVTPTGARVNRMFLVGVLTEIEQVNEEVLRARVVDPTGAFVVYAGQYQPDELAFLESVDPPMFVAVTGKARTFQPDDSDRVFTSVRPESITEVDAATRDRWTVATAEQTLQRVATMAAARGSDLRGDPLAAALEAGGVGHSLAAGVAMALEHYDTEPAYLEAVRELALDAARVVAGQRDEVAGLSRSPTDPSTEPVDLAALAAGGPGDPVVVDESAAAAAESTTSDAETVDTDDEAEDVDEEAEPASPDATADDSATSDASTEEAETAEASAEEAETADASTQETETADAGAEPAETSEASAEPGETEPMTATTSGGASAATADDDAGTASAEAADADEADAEPTADADTATDTEPAEEPASTTDADQSDTVDDGDDDLGDFEGGSFAASADDESAGDDAAEEPDTGEFDEDDVPDEVLDDEEREEIEAEFGTEFSTGAEVGEPGEAGIETPDAADAAPEADKEPEPEQDAVDDETAAATDDDADDAGAADADDEPAGDDAADEPDADVDLDDLVMDVMQDLDDGDGADREELIASVMSQSGADPGEVEDAIQDALMGGQCYEPDDDTLKPI
jgi:RPA family protein